MRGAQQAGLCLQLISAAWGDVVSLCVAGTKRPRETSTVHICRAGQIILGRQQSSVCRLEAQLPVQAASVAVEALANLMAGSSPGREAVRATGGVPVLVRLLDAGPWKDVTERATAAIAELVHTCPENQSLVSSWSQHQSDVLGFET